MGINLADFEAIKADVVKGMKPTNKGGRSVPFFIFDEGKAANDVATIAKAYHITRVEKSRDDLTAEMQALADDVYAGMMLFKCTDLERKIGDNEAWLWMLKNTPMGREYHRLLKSFLGEVGQSDQWIAKALDTAASGGGADFMPTNFSGTLIEDYRTDVFIYNAGHPTVRMTSDTFELPGAGTAVKSRLLSEQTGDNTHTETNFFTAVDPNTVSPQLSAVKLGFRTVFSNEVDENSVVPWIPFLQTQAKEAAQRGYEQAVISGDTNATHQDYDVHSASGNATDSRRAFLGFRGAVMDQTSNIARVDGGNGRPTDTQMTQVLAAMGKYGAKTRDVYIVGPPKARQWLRQMEEDRFDTSNDTYDGYQCYWSDEFPTNLHTSGINTNGGDNDTTGLVFVNKDRWIVGDRRAFQMKVVDREETDQKVIVASERVAFKQYDTTASVPTVGYLYNLE
jgi:hypothetical protein